MRLSEMRTDVDFGMLFSCLVMFFIILTITLITNRMARATAESDL